MNETRGAYFRPTDGGLEPVPEARSPWSADMLHGRLLAGLAARATEREDHDPALRAVRLTVDMFRPPPMAPLEVETTVIRSGHRIRVLDVLIGNAEVAVARARVLLLRTGPHPHTTAWRAPDWDAPMPEEVPAQPEWDTTSGWELRVVSPGGFWTSDRKRLWARDRWQLVAGEPLTPLVRAALAADLPNPMANAGADGLKFINADLTLFLGRVPESEWIGLEVGDHVGSDGVAIGSCTMYDTAGVIGSSSVCAMATTTGLAG